MPLSVLMLVHVCACVWLIFFSCVISQKWIKDITSFVSECVTLFVTTFVNMDIGKAWLNAPKNSQNKRLAHSWDLTRSFACCLICSQVHLPCLLGTFGVYEICGRPLKNWFLCDYLDLVRHASRAVFFLTLGSISEHFTKKKRLKIELLHGGLSRVELFFWC